MVMDGRQSGEWDGTKCQNDRILGCRKSALGLPLYMAVEKRKRDKKPEYMGVAQKSVRKTLIPDRGRKLSVNVLVSLWALVRKTLIPDRGRKQR